MVTAKILTLADVLLNICIRNILKNYQSEDKGRKGETRCLYFTQATEEVI